MIPTKHVDLVSLVYLNKHAYLIILTHFPKYESTMVFLSAQCQGLKNNKPIAKLKNEGKPYIPHLQNKGFVLKFKFQKNASKFSIFI